MKKLALNKRGKLTYCSSLEENIGKGRCDHLLHQKESETIKMFVERAEKHFDVKKSFCIIPGCKNLTSSAEKENGNFSRMYCSEHSKGVEYSCTLCGEKDTTTASNYMNFYKTGIKCKSCSPKSNIKRIQKRGIIKECENCKHQYNAKSARQKYCSECYYKISYCEECNKKIETRRIYETPKFCSQICKNQFAKKEKIGIWDPIIQEKTLEAMRKAQFPWLNLPLEEQIEILKDKLQRSEGQQARYIKNSLDRLKLRASGQYGFVFEDEYEEKIKNSKSSDYWIYGHLYNGEIYYVGQTKRTPMIRYVEHLEQREKAINGDDIRFESLLEYEKKTGITEEVIKNTKVIILDKISRENMTEIQQSFMLDDAERKYIQAYKPKLNFYYINPIEE